MHFLREWEGLRQRVNGLNVNGPLKVAAAMAGLGRARSEALQHLITTQVEQVTRDELHADVLRLPRTDTRRMAWMSCDTFSSQWVASWPRGPARGLGKALTLDGFGGLEFGEVFSTYLGRESPVVRKTVERIMRARGDNHLVHVPDGHASRAGRPPVCDSHGLALGSATLPGGGVTTCHDGCAEALFNIIETAGIRMEREPQMFISLIPAGSLVGVGAPRNIKPDAYVDVALPTANPPRRGRGQRPKPGPTEPLRRHLIDVKTVYGGTTHYHSARAANDQSTTVQRG